MTLQRATMSGWRTPSRVHPWRQRARAAADGASPATAAGWRCIGARAIARRALFLTAQVMLDVIAMTLLMHASGGVKSGIGLLLLVSLAAAAAAGPKRSLPNGGAMNTSSKASGALRRIDWLSIALHKQDVIEVT